jgi:serine phosphatase RsbU (regulator of sigma subunit)
VAGTGLKAAVIMGRMRSAVRSYALETEDPAEVLARLDAKMRHFEPDAMATVLCVMITPALDEMRISTAGHLPPMLAVPGQPAQVAEVPPDVLIGAASRRPRHTATMALPPGALLCLYTDGLVERRGQSIDHGLARLRAALVATDPETACVKVMGAMSEHSPWTDDIALLMLRRRPSAGAAPGRLAGAR